MTTGDHLWTEAGARSEIHIGSTAIRLAPETAFAFLNLDDQTIQIRLSQGSLNLRVRQLGESEVFEIDTPNVTVSLLSPGLYRVDVDADGNTTVTDRIGEAEVTASNSAFAVHPRQTATVTGIDSLVYDIRDAYASDDWDNWCLTRDQREDQAASARYVSREMIGYEDLDEYGVWRVVPEYGPVWVPTRVAAGWAPYHYGHWIWAEPWGWTWVDDAPWGFAPFHYGRWAYLNGSWAWVPGSMAPRPVYAPALVAFVGGGDWHASLSPGGGVGVAWFPLGPREVYVPNYHASDNYVRNVNVSHVNVTNINVTNINITNVNYVNRTAPGAVTAVPQETFVRAQPVAKAAVVVPQQAIVNVKVTGMTAPVAPRHESVVARSAGARAVAQPPAAALDRPVCARTPPPPPPVPFAAREHALAAHPGQPLDSATLTGLHQNAPPARPLVKLASPGANNSNSSPLRPARAGLAAPRPVSAGAAHSAPPNMPLTTQPKPTEGAAPVRGEHADRSDKPMVAPPRDNVGSDRPEHRDTAPTRPEKNQPTAPANARGEQKVDRPIDHNDRPDKPMVAPHATESKPSSDKPGVKPEPKRENGATDLPEHGEKIDAAPARSEKNQSPTPAKAGSEEKGRAVHPNEPNKEQPKEPKKPIENEKEKAKPKAPEGSEKSKEKEKEKKDKDKEVERSKP
ncbi:MAG: hypothetical protein J2P21_17985 [Chloracidobacterium sp.]|nr:hypothetical protein [Chloracidobacterium sp.]